MALALELSDTQAERIPQQQPARRTWQRRDSRGPTGVSPAQQSQQPSGPVVQTQGASGRAAVLRSPMVRVSQAEKAERARLGLCYFCPEKWVMGHVCKQRLLCYAEEEKKETAEGDLGVSKSRDEKHGATEKTNINLRDFVGVEMKKVSALLAGGVNSVKGEESSRIKKPGGSSLVVSEVPTEVSMEICEEENAKDETVDKESSEEVRLRSLKRPVEAISDEKSDPVAADSVKSEGKTEETCHGNDGEILGSDGQKDGEMHHDDSGVEKKSIGEKDVCAAENTNLIPNESENRSDKIDDAKVEPKDQTDDVSHAGPESVHEKSFENRAGKTEANKGRGLDVEVNDEAEETVQSKMGRVQTYVKARCVFDPGGDASLKLLLATLVVGLWFPP